LWHGRRCFMLHQLHSCTFWKQNERFLKWQICFWFMISSIFQEYS
jgi:hypothetical protein